LSGISQFTATGAFFMRITSFFVSIFFVNMALVAYAPEADANSVIKGKKGKCEVTANNKKYVLSGCGSVVKTTKNEAVGFCFPRIEYICTWKLK
jgi:hypothetical protein